MPRWVCSLATTCYSPGVNELAIGLLGALLATNQPAAISNLVAGTTGLSVDTSPRNDPVEQEYLKLLADDDDAQAEVDRWIREHQAFVAEGADSGSAALARRIEERFAPVKKAYDEFLSHHSDHVDARLAYGSFLDDIGDESAALTQWEKARELDPKNPAAWNNLANHYGHRGPVKKALEFYEQAVKLDPEEPVYYQNLATTVYLFRTDAMEYYHIDEDAVFERALDLYRKALRLAPQDFPLATDLAQSYYGFRHKVPPEKMAQWKADALKAWHEALKIANDDIEREGVYTHLARIEILTGGYAAAREHLSHVVHPMYSAMKARLHRNILRGEGKASDPALAPVPGEKQP